MCDYNPDGVWYGFILVTNAGHGVDLEAAAQDVTVQASVSEGAAGRMKVDCTYNGYVHVWATAPEMAPASSFLTASGFFSPSGVRTFRKCSYVMKFKPTYGATPATVGMIPLYNAATPPSVLYMVIIVVHMPGSSLGFARAAKEADWIERRVRTISRGYVNVTEVIPAMPPHVRRAKGDKSASGYVSNMFCIRLQRQPTETTTMQQHDE